VKLAEFAVNGDQFPIESVWVHLQRPDLRHALPFTLAVAAEYVKVTFDPHSICPDSMRLDDYLMDLISELGGFVLGGYLKKLRDLQHKKQGPFQWVIAAIDRVEETEAAVILHGQVVPFEAVKPLFKELC
jgi:hypothetical protein